LYGVELPEFCSHANWHSWKTARKIGEIVVRGGDCRELATWESAVEAAGQSAATTATRLPLAFAEYDATFGQIVWRELDADAVSRHDADEVLPHPAGNVGHHNVPAFNLHAEPRIGEGLCDDTLDFQRFFFLFFHEQPGIRRQVGSGGDRPATPLGKPLQS
jgi:hypothetical protein